MLRKDLLFPNKTRILVYDPYAKVYNSEGELITPSLRTGNIMARGEVRKRDTLWTSVVLDPGKLLKIVTSSNFTILPILSLDRRSVKMKTESNFPLREMMGMQDHIYNITLSPEGAVVTTKAPREQVQVTDAEPNSYPELKGTEMVIFNSDLIFTGEQSSIKNIPPAMILVIPPSKK